MAFDNIQGDADWHSARLGRVTASRVADVLAKTKSGPAASRANYLAELLLERITGRPTECFVNDAMRQGIEREPQARAAYVFQTDRAVEPCGFIVHPRIAMAGASPDGLIGTDGVLEIKAPQPKGHLETLEAGCVPPRYFPQVQWQLACAGRAWADFVSFNPDFPAGHDLFVCRVERDDAWIKEAEAEVEAFLDELAAKAAKYGAVA